MPATTRSTGTRFSSAEGSPGKFPASSADRARLGLRRARPLPAASIACWARPNALMGAFTTLVSPRLLPVRESPITIDGRSCATRRPVLDQAAVGLDRRHRLRQLVEVVVEVAREDERVLLRPSTAACGRGCTRSRWRRGPRRPSRAPAAAQREGERVAAAQHVGAERLARRASSKETLAAQWITCVSDRPQRRAAPRRRGPGPAARCRLPRSGTSAPARPSMCSRLSSSAPRCCGVSTFTTSFVFGSRIVSGRTTATSSSMRRSSRPGPGSPCPGSRWPR